MQLFQFARAKIIVIISAVLKVSLTASSKSLDMPIESSHYMSVAIRCFLFGLELVSYALLYVCGNNVFIYNGLETLQEFRNKHWLTK